MIRIDLVDKTNKLKHIEFRAVPVTEKKDYTCIPENILPLRSIVRFSRQLKAGVCWEYRQICLVSADRSTAEHA